MLSGPSFEEIHVEFHSSGAWRVMARRYLYTYEYVIASPSCVSRRSILHHTEPITSASSCLPMMMMRRRHPTTGTSYRSIPFTTIVAFTVAMKFVSVASLLVLAASASAFVPSVVPLRTWCVFSCGPEGAPHQTHMVAVIQKCLDLPAGLAFSIGFNRQY